MTHLVLDAHGNIDMSALKPGQEIRPRLTPDAARLLAEQLYGIKIASIKELNSYDDRNYLVRVERVSDESYVSKDVSQRYMLKVLNSMDSQKKHVAAEHEVMHLLHKKGFHCPLPVNNLRGEELSIETITSTATSTDGKSTTNNNQVHTNEHIVRLLTFLEGKIFVDIPYDPYILYQSGKFIGGIEKAIQSYTHPALESHVTIWALDSVPKLTAFIHAVQDEDKRALATHVMQAFNDEVLSLAGKLNKGIIHGDYNEQNIIVRESVTSSPTTTTNTPATTGAHEVFGIIDFGDVMRSCYVYEVAITIMYMMVESTVVHPLDVGGHVLAGYLSERELSDEEWGVLHHCIAGRYVQSLVMGAYTYSQDPGNEYLLVTAKKGWNQLRELWDTPKDELYAKWRQTIRQYHL